MSFKAKLSENGTEVILTHNDKRVETMLLNEFVTLFGTDILKEYDNTAKRPKSEPSCLQIQEYYDAIQEVIRANEELDDFIRNHHHAVKSIVTFRRKFKHLGPCSLAIHMENEKIHKIEMNYIAIRINYTKSLELMNYWSKVVGFDALPSNKSLCPDLDGEISLERFSNLLFSQDYFRENMRRVVNKYCEQGVAVSIYELAEEALAW